MFNACKSGPDAMIRLLKGCIDQRWAQVGDRVGLYMQSNHRRTFFYVVYVSSMGPSLGLPK